MAHEHHVHPSTVALGPSPASSPPKNHTHHHHEPRGEGRPALAPRPATRSHAGSHDHAAGGHGSMVADFRRRFFVTLILTPPVLLLSPMIRHWLGLGETLSFPGDGIVLFVLSTVVYGYGGWPFLKGAAAELRQRQPGMMTLIAMAISAAYLFSAATTFGLPGEAFYWELVTLIAIMLLGHWIEMRSVMGASRALEELVRLLPDSATLVGPDGSLREVPITSLEPGDRVVVRPGSKVPVDGRIVDGRSEFNEAMLTGESMPVAKAVGNVVIGGAVNGAGAVTIEVRAVGESTYLAQVVDLVRKAQATRSRTQDIANRAAAWLTYIALAVGFITFASWLIAGQSLQFALERMVTVMVVACPHALGLAVPLVVAVSTSLSARNGLLIRDRAAFERARNLNLAVFDKTGTLTEGRFGVSEVVLLGDGDENVEVALAASAESRSEHPIARAIVRLAADRNLGVPVPSEVQNLTGEGIRAVVNGQDLRIVSPGYLARSGRPVADERLGRLEAEGKTVVVLLREGEPRALFALADIVRPESREAITELRQLGIEPVMLTGDAERVAAAVAADLGITRFFAEVLPAHKADKVRELQAEGFSVAMVGDGVNDAPALVQADLGIAVGAGTDVAVESADVVLVRSDPRDVAAILGLSRATYRKLVQNLLWATGYNTIAIPMAAGITFGTGFLMTPAVAAVFMSASTVIVALNAQLLRFYRGRR